MTGHRDSTTQLNTSLAAPAPTRDPRARVDATLGPGGREPALHGSAPPTREQPAETTRRIGADPDLRVNTKRNHHQMARLVGVDLPREKRVEIALTYIYGVGRTSAAKALEATGVDPNLRVKDLGDEQLVALRDWIEENLKVEGDLRREVQADIRRKVEIGSYQGIRHRRGLPVHGQRTKTNARTRKGPKRTVAGKKK